MNVVNTLGLYCWFKCISIYSGIILVISVYEKKYLCSVQNILYLLNIPRFLFYAIVIVAVK